MKRNKIKILSTKVIGKKLIAIARQHNIQIDEIPFIEIKHNVSPGLQRRVSALARQTITVVISSANTVYGLQRMVTTNPPWSIFCIGQLTKRKLEAAFGEVRIVGTADSSVQLAEEILKHPGVKNIYYFSSNQRQSQLPEKLKTNGIELNELALYQTIEIPNTVSVHYDGILFFSPSGVRSYFINNRIGTHTILFAIGKTTANCLKDFTDLPVVISELPDPAQIVGQVIEYFKGDRWQ